MKKKNPPRLGPKGYCGHESHWQKEAKSIKTSTTVHKIVDPRARNYLLGQTYLDEDVVRIVPPAVQAKVKELEELSERNIEFESGSDLLTLLEGRSMAGVLGQLDTLLV